MNKSKMVVLTNGDDIPIWDEDMVGYIIYCILVRFKYISDHAQCWCTICAVGSSYGTIIRELKGNDVIFKNVDNIVLYMYDNGYKTPVIFNTYGRVLYTDIAKIAYSLLKYRERLWFNWCHVIDEDGMDSRSIEIKITASDRGDQDILPPIDESKLCRSKTIRTPFVLSEDEFIFDEEKIYERSEDGEFTQEATYNQLVRERVPRYFLDYLVKKGAELYWQNC